MPYNLRYFSDFISENFSPVSHVKSLGHYDHLKGRLAGHAKHCKNQLAAEIIACTTGEQLSLRIRNEQVLLISIMDQLDVMVNFGADPDMYYLAKDDDQVNLAKQLYMILTEMLHHLFTYFSAQFDSTLHLPALYRKTRSLEMDLEVAAVRYGLRGAGVGESLLKILDEPFNCLNAAHSGRKPSFHQCFYLEKLVRDLGTMLSDDVKEKTDAVIDLLFTLNFNHPAFADHCIRRFKKQLNAETGTDDIEMLQSLSARVDHYCHQSASAWDPAWPSLRDRLTTWLQAERSLLEWMPKTEAVHPPNAIPASLARIQTIMNVPQLAHMLRLMVETGVYINLPAAEAIRFQSGNFSAPLSKNISPESMRQKYYTPDSPTAAAVRGLLRKLIAHSNKLAP